LGWPGPKSAERVPRAAERFDLFMTADQNLRYQHNLRILPVAVAVPVAKSNRIQSLGPLLPGILAALARIQPRTLLRVGA